MVRIIGADVPDNKRLEIALTYVYGIGRKLSNQIIAKLGLDPDLRAVRLTEDDVARINTLLQSGGYVVEGDLRRQVQNNIKRLISIRSRRGDRHLKGLPIKGRTRTNARTRKGKRKTVANKKK